MAIAACDLAEVIGSAIALQLLFHIPLVIGVVITGFDVLLLLLLENRGFRYIEAHRDHADRRPSASASGWRFFFRAPEYGLALQGMFVPVAAILHDPMMLYIAIGILGATVMPHNLYLHSSIVQTPRLRAHSGGAARGAALLQHRLGGGADDCAVCECGDPDCRGGDLLSRRAASTWRRFRMPTS